MNLFKDQVVIITGGAQGIGKIAAEHFVREGAQTIIWDSNETAGQDTAKALQTIGEAEFQHVDVTDYASVEKAVRAAVDQFGRIDVLINNAGITRDATLAKMTPDQWKQVLDVNLTGVFNCTKLVSPTMIERNYGRIINTASVVGLYGNFGQSNYAATKSGILGLTKVWARELGRKGITVNAVAPGFIATEMITTVPEKVISVIVEHTPVGRLGKPEEIAHAYAFLASAEAAFINGAVLSVDGGYIG